VIVVPENYASLIKKISELENNGIFSYSNPHITIARNFVVTI